MNGQSFSRDRPEHVFIRAIIAHHNGIPSKFLQKIKRGHPFIPPNRRPRFPDFFPLLPRQHFSVLGSLDHFQFPLKNRKLSATHIPKVNA